MPKALGNANSDEIAQCWARNPYLQIDTNRAGQAFIYTGPTSRLIANCQPGSRGLEAKGKAQVRQVVPAAVSSLGSEKHGTGST
jgi:hypothetical protein